MRINRPSLGGVCASLLFALAGGCAAPADEPTAEDLAELNIAQNSTWTIQRGAPQTYRVVAYGDSIFAGFQRSFGAVARRAAPLVAGEYLGGAWGANVEVVRRALTGGLASEVNDLVSRDKSYMEAATTHAVYFEMCGNDYLQVRKEIAASSGRCDYAKLDSALQTCVTYTEKAMLQINASAPAGARKVVSNLYYPGYNADNGAGRCTDPSTGVRIDMQKVFLQYLARSNWKTCDLARQHGFRCADAFAEFMGADMDTNGDGMLDADGLRFDPSESMDAYVERMSVRLRSTVRDANEHGVAAGANSDYIFSDDIHPTVFGTATISAGASGQGAPDFTDAQIVDGKNPQWNKFGHERMGYALWRATSAP